MIIGNTNSHHIYLKWKESKMPERQRERESVCVCAIEGGYLQDEVASVVKMTIEETDHLV